MVEKPPAMKELSPDVAKPIVLGCINFALCLLADEVVLFALRRCDSDLILEAIRTSLDLLSDVAFRLGVKQEDVVWCDLGPEPERSDGIENLLKQCKAFLVCISLEINRAKCEIDWTQIGVRAQTFSATLYLQE